MLKFHIIFIKFSIFTGKNSQSNTFFPKLKNTIVKINIKCFYVYQTILTIFVKKYSEKIEIHDDYSNDFLDDLIILFIKVKKVKNIFKIIFLEMHCLFRRNFFPWQ